MCALEHSASVVRAQLTRRMGDEFALIVTAILIAIVSMAYATAGQAGGTAFLAIMAFMGLPATELRPTALALNIMAAGYATWRIRQTQAVNWRLVRWTVVAFLPGWQIHLLVVDALELRFSL